MASVFFYYIASFRYPSDPHDQLNQPPRAGRYSRSLQHILDSSSTEALASLLLATTVQSRLHNPSHPFMEPRLMMPTYL